MDFWVLSALGAILSYGVFNDGGAHRAEWRYCLVAFGALGLIYFGLRAFRGGMTPKLERRTLWLLGCVVAICVLQTIPIPLTVLRIISPGTLAIYQPAFAMIGSGRYAPISVEPSATFEGTLNLLAYILVFTIVSSLTAQSPRVWIRAAPLVVIGVLEAIVGVLQAGYNAPGTSISGTYANRNHFAGLLEMCLPFAVMWPLAIWQRNNRESDRSLSQVLQCCGLLVVAAVILIGIVDSHSRMGFIATLASLLLVGVLVLTGRVSGGRKWIPIVALGFLVVLAFFLLPSSAFIARFGGTIGVTELSSDTRRQIWADTLGLLKTFPVFGCGFGAYQSAFMRYQTAAPMTTVNFAHNDYLQFLVELGLVGFVPLLAVAIRVVYTAIERLREANVDYERCFHIACLGSITAMALHSLVDFNLYMPANATVLSWVTAMASARKPGLWKPNGRGT